MVAASTALAFRCLPPIPLTASAFVLKVWQGSYRLCFVASSGSEQRYADCMLQPQIARMAYMFLSPLKSYF